MLSRGRALSDAFREHFAGFDAHVFRSGTDSLAAALTDAREGRPRAHPEAIIPAYGCPDLVAACVSAGVRPRLVDVSPDAWGYDMDALPRAMTADTIAVVAVNLLGVGDQAAELSELARSRDLALIQDSAQYMPDRTHPLWPGDYVVLSFGRGKPLNLLGGGAVLARAERRSSMNAIGRDLRTGERVKFSVLSSAPTALAFNLLSHPTLYGIASALPGLGVGETRYSPLGPCARAPGGLAPRLAAAFIQYASQRNYRDDVWHSSLRRWESDGVRALQCADGIARTSEPKLRLPLLARSKELRDAIVGGLREHGIGASAFYERSLDCTRDIPRAVREQGPFPGAQSLADRLLTLPTHSLVDQATVARAEALVCSLSSRF